MVRQIKRWVCRHTGCDPRPVGLHGLTKRYWKCARCEGQVDMGPIATFPKGSVHINRIMAQFDFEQVHKVMALLDWKWDNGAVCGQDFRVPTLAEIRAHAREMLEEISDPNCTALSMSCGGFEVTKGRGECRLRLAFMIDECEEVIRK